MEQLKKWFVDFHSLMQLCSLDDKKIQVINDQLTCLNINCKISEEICEKIKIEINDLDKIYIHFIKYYDDFISLNYCSFEETENNRLVLYNILERYLIVLKKVVYKSKKGKTFIKLVNLRINSLITKSKNFDLFDSKISSMFWVMMIISILLIMFVVFKVVLDLVSPLCLDMLKRYLSLSNITYTIVHLIFLILTIIIPIFLPFLVLLLCRNKLNKFFPELILRFPRSTSEMQNFYSVIAISLSVIAIIVSMWTL